MRALDIAATGMFAQQTRVEVISHNIANLSTTGYDARRAEFADLIYQNMARPGAFSSDQGTILPAGLQLGLGVRPVAVSLLPKQGALLQTEGNLDLAVDGQGYFQVTLPDGTAAYTRDGSFKLSQEGVLVTSQGYPVEPQVTVPQDALQLSINQTGEVYAHFRNQADPQLLGTLNLSTFINPRGLEAVGDNLYLVTTASGEAQTGLATQEGRGQIRQGYLESSSVNVVHELTQLIEAQRGYEMNSKVITATDQMMGINGQIR